MLAVIFVVLFAHWPALSTHAYCFDDREYIIDNPLVQNPSWTSAKRFLGEVLTPSSVSGYYQPLTMISLMLDRAVSDDIYDLEPFHRTSLMLHIGNVLLVFILFWRLWGQPWAAAIVALLFGVHPMTVEAIPWASERKTLLAAFFSLSCLILYVRFTRNRGWLTYGGCLGLYVLALMSKPTSTPLPVCLLLLDWWPLRRLNKQCFIEKIPFFLIAILSSIVTVISQARTCAILMPTEYDAARIPLVICHNIIFYLYKIVWPTHLTAHYPFPEPLSLASPAVLVGVLGTCVLIGLLLASLSWTRSLLTGWLYFFVAIFPTMGVIGFTIVIASDKYAYLPSIGLMLPLVCFLAWLWRPGSPTRWRSWGKVGILSLTVLLTASEIRATRHYLRVWKDTETLHMYMLTYAPNSPHLHNNLGSELARKSRLEEAVVHYQRTLELNPQHRRTQFNLATALWGLKRPDEALPHFRKAVELEPDHAEARNNLAVLLHSRGQVDEAAIHLTEAIRLKPDYVDAHYNRGAVLLRQRQVGPAIREFQQVLRLRPDHKKARRQLNNILKQRPSRSTRDA